MAPHAARPPPLKGFSGIENALFFADNTRMLYGDGQKAIGELIQEVKALR